MRLYVNSHSYPELREVDATAFGRGFIWLRAGWSAFSDGGFRAFVVIEAALVLSGLVAAVLLVRTIDPANIVTRMATVALGSLAFQMPAMIYAVTRGGDVLRPHLRAVHDTARVSCPACGHGLRAQIDGVPVPAEGSAPADVGRVDGEVAPGEPDPDVDVVDAAAAAATGPIGDPPPPEERITCPECGADVPRCIGWPPHAIPLEHLAWGRSWLAP